MPDTGDIHPQNVPYPGAWPFAAALFSFLATFTYPLAPFIYHSSLDRSPKGV